MSIIGQMILEGKVNDAVDTVKIRATRFYQHCLKWKHFPNMQCTSWINTIRAAAIEINDNCYSNNKPNTNIISRSNKILIDAYEDGALEAKKELKKKNNINVDFIKIDNEEIYDDFPNIDKIIDLDYIKEWLFKYAVGSDSFRIVDNMSTEED